MDPSDNQKNSLIISQVGLVIYPRMIPRIDFLLSTQRDSPFPLMFVWMDPRLSRVTPTTHLRGMLYRSIILPSLSARPKTNHERIAVPPHGDRASSATVSFIR